MIGQTSFRLSDRKLWLFAIACARQVWDKVHHQDQRAYEALDQYLLTGNEEVLRGHWAVPLSLPPGWGAGTAAVFRGPDFGGSPATQAAIFREVVGNPFRPAVVLPRDVGVVLDDMKRGRRSHRQEDVALADWLTPTVLSLAQAAYEERQGDGTLDPLRLLVLADALEEAGCVDERCKECNGSGTYTVQVRNAALSSANGYGTATTYSEWRGCRHCGGDHDRKGTGRLPNPLLAHLRSPGPHVRGCWATDLLLGRE